MTLPLSIQPASHSPKRAIAMYSSAVRAAQLVTESSNLSCKGPQSSGNIARALALQREGLTVMETSLWRTRLPSEVRIGGARTGISRPFFKFSLGQQLQTGPRNLRFAALEVTREILYSALKTELISAFLHYALQPSHRERYSGGFGVMCCSAAQPHSFQAIPKGLSHQPSRSSFTRSQ